jgi:hypothetical protein
MPPTKAKFDIKRWKNVLDVKIKKEGIHFVIKQDSANLDK